jgi:hypothetical protein
MMPTAPRELDSRKKHIQKLSASVDLSLKSTAERNKREEIADTWLKISEADLCFLTSNKPGKVANLYRDALAGAKDFEIDAVRRQMTLYQQLDLLQENVQAVLMFWMEQHQLPHLRQRLRRDAFFFLRGHMIDAPNRAEPRFPANKVDVATEKITAAITSEQQISGGIAYGVAGCASGGDIIFHKACEAMGIPTRIFLALPRELYIRASVAPAGPEWVEEFNRLVRLRRCVCWGSRRSYPLGFKKSPTTISGNVTICGICTTLWQPLVVRMLR